MVSMPPSALAADWGLLRRRLGVSAPTALRGLKMKIMLRNIGSAYMLHNVKREGFVYLYDFCSNCLYGKKMGI